MRLFMAGWSEGGKLGQRTFHQRKLAVEFAREKVQAPDASPVSIWRYEATGPVLQLLMLAHDRTAWWSKKTYEGTVLKSGAWTTR